MIAGTHIAFASIRYSVASRLYPASAKLHFGESRRVVSDKVILRGGPSVRSSRAATIPQTK